MLITLTKNSGQRATVELISDNGEILAVPRLISRHSETDVKWLASLGCEELSSTSDVNKALSELCGENEESGEPNRQGYEVEDSRVPPHLIGSNEGQETYFECMLRDIEQPRVNAVQYVDTNPELAFKEALQAVTELREPVIEWTEGKQFICLDVDYHELPLEYRPTEDELARIVHKVSPLPYCWHMSHGRGAKLYYASKPGFSAEELASVAALLWVQLDPRATFDLIKSTRHPLYARSRDGLPAPCASFDSIKFTHGAGDVSSLRRIIQGELDDSDIQEFLQSRNWRIGQTLPHSECPISPTDDTKQSVFIGEAGVYCHKCSARGLGAVRPGFVGFSQLSGKQLDSRLYRMLRNFCHWEHARIVLSHMFPNIPIKLLQTVYKVLLKITHTHDDPRVGMAMHAGKGFIRVRGQWVSTDGEHALEHGLPVFVKSLPACLFPGEDGLAVSIPAMTAFSNSLDLSEYGYEDVALLRGCKVYGHYNRSEEITKVIVRKEFRKCPPEYVPLHKRMPSVDAWAIVQNEFPGIDENYLRLLIAAKGSAEGRLSQCPFLLVAGVSGSGKSTTVQIAAGICGDKASEPIFVPHIDRFRQSLMDASRSSGFILVNEVFKNATRAKLTPTQALDPMLSLTEDSRSHVLYVGSVPFGRLPVFVLTDISIPIEVEQDIQLSRRFTYYRLKANRNYWSDTFINKRVQPHEFRLISADHNSAADSILSEVIDRWFKEPTSLETIAKSLDIQSLQSYSEDMDDTTARLVKLYEYVCEAPDLIGQDKVRKPGPGWKRIERMGDTPIRNLYDEFADGQTPEMWSSSRTLQAEDWAAKLKLPFPVICELRHYRNIIVYIRFRSTDSVKTPSWVNGKFIK